MDDSGQASPVRPWGEFDLNKASRRIRRFEHYGLWFIVFMAGTTLYRGQIKKKVCFQLERWDYEDKYWRDGYWVKEFPEGMCEVTYANGAVSVEPGMSPIGWTATFKKKLYKLE